VTVKAKTKISRLSAGRASSSLLLCALAILALLPAPASAKKTHLFRETFGSAAKPTFANVNGLAVDQSSRDLLVIDPEARTLSRFKPDGTPDNFSALGTNTIDAKGSGNCATVLADCDQTPQNGLSFGPFPGEGLVAIDNSGTATDGNIYVPQLEAHVLDVFAKDGEYLGQITKAGATSFSGFSPCGIAVDPGGNLFVSGITEDKVHKFDPSTNPPLDSDYVASFDTVSRPCSLAAGAGPSTGSLFVNTFFTFKGNSVLQLDSASGALKSIVDPGEARAVTVDPGTGHLYVLHENAPLSYTIREYSGSTLLSSTAFGTDGGTGRAIAFDGASGTLYAGGRSSLYVYGPTVTVPDATTEAATITSDTSATLHGTVNPDGVALTDCRFEYGTSAAYGQTVPCAESLAEIGSGATPKAVHAELSGLGSETLYHFRLVAKNANAALYPNDPAGTARGADRTFKTPSKPAISEEQAADVGFTEARLKAQVNPENSPTTYRFEWGTDTTYGQSTAEIAIGSGEAAHPVSLALEGLNPGTTYHYRVVATNTIGLSEGADHALTTFAPLAPGQDGPCANEPLRPGPAAFLPDCRGYEMVSPLDKNNGDILVPEEYATSLPASLNQSSLSGDKLTYSSTRTFGDAASSAYSAQYVAARDPEQGWRTHAVVPPRGAPVLTPGKQTDTEFKAFSPDLCNAWLRTTAEPVLAEGGIPRYPNLYRRADEECSGPGFESLMKPPSFETSESLYAGQHYASLELQGVSGDGSKGIYVVADNLTEDAPAQPPNCLKDLAQGAECSLRLYAYDAADASLHFVCVLPNGSIAKACSAGRPIDPAGTMRENRTENALSEDGSRVFWTAFSGLPSAGPIYLRENPSAEQSEVAGGECTEPDKACTIAVSKAAEALSGTSASEYWAAAKDGSVAIFTSGKEPAKEDLYEFDVDKKTTSLIAHEAIGVMGMSDDASYLYFASKEDLASGAEAGMPNLYLYHGGSFSFVATLVQSDLANSEFTPVENEPRGQVSRVSPDGRHAAFMSFGRLTGYDNTDASNGKLAAEVYLYDAGANEGEGKLICASCNPSGARPLGANVAFKPQPVTFWAAAQIPRGENSLYAARVLSDDGKRLFFASSDTLSPRDTNGRQDVYQWEQEGAGGCDREDAGFVPSSGGCLALISSGKSPLDSEFLDASPDGHDVFFSTLSSLVSQDYGLVDVYDARVGGGFPEPLSPRAPCEGEACQSPPEAPNDPTPASSAFQGAGNVVEEKPTSCRKPKVRRRGRCVARKHHQPAKHKQAENNGRAGR
jgi:hypothetical protein